MFFIINKIIYWIIILLVLLVLIGMTFFSKVDILPKNIINKKKDDPTYQSDYSNTVIFNHEGILNYQLVVQHVECFLDKKITWFTQPVITILDANKTPVWLIKSNKAKLINNNILYLYGNSEVRSLIPNFNLRKLITNSAQINLITQDIISQDLVTLYGKRFNSTGFKMRGNLRTKNAELFEKVKTSYEIPNKQTKP